MKPFDQFNYILGTQAFNPNYRFTDLEPEMEIAERIWEMGSDMIKFHVKDETMIEQIMSRHHFSYVFLWYRSTPYFKEKDGYTAEKAKNDYDAVYEFTKKLLTSFNNSGTAFYIGHWEGDWYFTDNYNTAQKTVNAQITQGMIQWLNTRQKAVDDAKRDTPHKNVYVWNYVEINRPRDAMDFGYDRVVNRVLPFTDVDFVSYSAYDCMDLTTDEVKKTIDYIYSNLKAKESVPGPRVFIGEMGQPAANCRFDPQYHCSRNITNIAKFLQCDVKHILYWQMYCNEKLEDGSSRGFWLINDKNEKQPLYDCFESILKKAKEYVKSFSEQYGRVPNNAEYRSFLLSLPEFQTGKD